MATSTNPSSDASATPVVPDLMRLATAGSVDDGKSTLIGRLLFESQALCEDTILAVKDKTRQDLNGELDFSLFTDGLKDEREQGITIDVAYRSFLTPQRRFIIADTPGHEQYTRNMVTGASNADLAIILVDASKGLTTQSKRHAFIAALLGIPHVVVCINKMDLVDYSQEVYESIKRDFDNFAGRLNVHDLSYVPVSALKGDNVVGGSDNMPWYQGGPLLNRLTSTYLGGDRNRIDLRFPVQYVSRPDPSFRGYCGTVSSGTIRKGDEIVVLPSGRSTTVKSIETFGGQIEQAGPGEAVTICLQEELDVSRGDTIVHSKNVPKLIRELDAMLVWMAEEPMQVGKAYLVRHTTREVKGRVRELEYRINPNSLSREDATGLKLNEIGRATLTLYNPLAVDDYQRNRSTGGFVLIDPVTNGTVGAGLVLERGRREAGFGGDQATEGQPTSQNITRTTGRITPKDRANLLGQSPVTLWLTGLSGSGKSTVAFAIEELLNAEGRACYVLDGDNVRHGLCRDLGFAPHERSENVRRVAEVAHLMNEAGVIVISAFISPFREDRAAAREIIGEKSFAEIFINAPLETCEARDPKGLYQKARDGKIPQFTGISSPYEAPESPSVQLNTDELTPTESAQRVLDWLRQQGLIPG